MKKARGGKQTLLLLLLLTPTTRFVFCPLRVEGVCFPIPPSGCAQPLCLGTACLGQRQKWKDTNIRGKKKRRKNKTEKELLLQNFQPIKPRAGLLQESQVSQNPRPRGLKKWSQDLHPPCHRDPKGFGGAEHRHTAQQPVQAPRHTAPQASTSFLPLHFHRFVCVCVYLRAPTSQPGKQLLAQMAFPLPQLFLLGVEASNISSQSSTRQSWGRAAQDNCPGREGTWLAGRTGVEHQTTLPSCSFCSNSVSEKFCCILSLGQCFPPAK